MCTVSLVDAGDRLRVLCNRDERHARAEARPPVVRRTAAGLSMFPIDPQGGGTWIAANDAGLVVAVLNGDGPPLPSSHSRGRLVLEMLGCTTLTDALLRADHLRRPWSPHRLIVADTRRVLELQIGEEAVDVSAYALTAPLLFTSSSLGRQAVEPVRRQLFDHFMRGAADALDAQDAFHRHRWPARPHVSVHMHRHDAATQSVTAVDVGPSRVRMRYEATREPAGQPAWLGVERRPVQSWPDRVAASPHRLALAS